MENIITLGLALDTDSYKLSHWVQYPPNTTGMFSYLESRGGKYDKTVFFGLQYYLKKFLSRPVTMEEVEEAREFAAAHGCPYNYEGWKIIVERHGGYLPVRIKAVPEGSVVPVSNILMSVESTDPDVFWITSWIETLLVRLWYPITVATQSWNIRRNIEGYLTETADDEELASAAFKLHDFGSRGVSSQESAMIGGAAHLINFMGSDTLAGIWMAKKYYNEPMAAFSIPAAEHSTMTMWGKDGEVDAFRNMLQQYGDGDLLACVSDSYDIINACKNSWGKELRQEVIDMNATLIVRPDSGVLPDIVIEVLDALAEAFGVTVNTKGYKVLDHVRVIQGDGVNEDSINEILETMKKGGYSASNIAFGMGGALLQKLDRDTQKFAFKCSWAMIDGKEVPVFKTPISDMGKRSKKGHLDLLKLNLADGRKEVHTVDYDANRNNGREESAMVTYYENGEILIDDTFAQIRERALNPWHQYTGWVEHDVY